MKTERILIVEDERKIANTLQFGLSEHGYTADVAYNGAYGYNLFRENKYDLVILDINLPALNGYELCKNIRTLNPDTPIIFLTAQNTLDDKVKGYQLGADDYVIKPFEFKELLMKIKVFLKRPVFDRSTEKELLMAGDLIMDINAMEVTRNNKQINLTSKELRLLEYLLRHKNKIISRQEIAHHVWQNDFESNTNVIDVYINYLRNKVDKISDVKLIHTLVGMGYILKDTEANASSS
ncbi:MAG TPA: response regulator transcription factor [Chitinophagaceae bacterium]